VAFHSPIYSSHSSSPFGLTFRLRAYAEGQAEKRKIEGPFKFIFFPYRQQLAINWSIFNVQERERRLEKYPADSPSTSVADLRSLTYAQDEREWSS
jgi:hypothetical protein